MINRAAITLQIIRCMLIAGLSVNRIKLREYQMGKIQRFVDSNTER